MIGPRGSVAPASPGSATSAGVSMTPITRRQPATAFCSSLRISVAVWTGLGEQLDEEQEGQQLAQGELAVRRQPGADDDDDGGGQPGHQHARW